MAMSETFRCPQCAHGVPLAPDDAPPSRCLRCAAPLDAAAEAWSREQLDKGQTQALRLMPPRRSGRAPGFLPGDVLAGRFRVICQLGAGGMGEVFRAEDLVVGGPVAIKVVRPEVVDSEEAATRLRREVKLARDVTHPNVCRTFDLYQHETENGESLAIVGMEFLDGEDLASCIRRGVMTVDDSLPILRQIARGLFAAHRLGIVHRDLKPSNVLLVPESGGTRAVVTDFGIARRTVDETHEADITLTQTGLTLGSPAYMAPEQLTGAPTTPATDVYALGLVAHELVTGESPFADSTPWLVVTKRLSEDPIDTAASVPGINPRYADFVKRCLAREPGERFEDMDAVLHWLDFGNRHWDAYGHKRPRTGGRGRDRASRFRVVRRAAASLVVVALAAGAWIRLSGSPAADQSDSVAAPSSADTADPDAISKAAESAPHAELTTAGDNVLVASLPAALKAVEVALARLDGAAALTALAPLLAAAPQDPQLLVRVADANAALGRTEEALRTAERALALADDLPREARLAIESRYHAFGPDWSRARDLARSLWTLNPSRLDYGIDAVSALLRAGSVAEAEQIVSDIRARHPAGEDPRVDLLASRVAAESNDSPRQIAEAHRAVEGARAAKAPLVLAAARLLEAAARRSLGDLDTAEAATDAAIEIGQQQNDRLLRAEAEAARGLLALQRGHLDAAVSAFGESLARFDTLGNPAGRLRALDALGSARRTMKDLESSQVQLERAIEIGTNAGLPVLANRARLNLASLSKDRGRYDEALALYEAVLAVDRQIGETRSTARAQLELADLFLRLGRAREALESATAARSWFGERQEKRHFGIASVLRATTLFAAGRPVEALEAIDTVLAQAPETPVRFLALVERCRLLLARSGDDALVAALDDLDQLAGDLREPGFLGLATWLRARADMQAGRDYDGVRRLTRALRSAELGDPILRARLELTAAEAHLLRQRLGLAESALQRAREQLGKTRDQALEWRGQIIEARLAGINSPRIAARRLAELTRQASDAGLLTVAIEARFARSLILGHRDGLASLAQAARKEGLSAVAKAAASGQPCVACF